MEPQRRALIGLGEGVYTVSQVCRILQPTMTPRKVHYWMNTGLLSPPIARGARGRPALLSFRQLLEIRTVQHLRDEIQVSLPTVREAFEWTLANLFVDDWRDVRFTKVGRRRLVVRVRGEEPVEVGTGQGVLDVDTTHINTTLRTTHEAWESKAYIIPGHPYVVSDTRVLAGAPTVKGTRIETAFLASFAVNGKSEPLTVREIHELYPVVSQEAVRDSLTFEGVAAA